MTDLEKLEKALEDYQNELDNYWVKYIPFMNVYRFDVSEDFYKGMCWYFRVKFDSEVLPQSLKTAYQEEQDRHLTDEFLEDTYWYDPGHLKPRIKILKKAIRIEKQLNYE